MKQIPLGLALNQGHRFANFVAGGNAELLNHLRRPATEFVVTWIWGPSSSGKSHLLHAACRECAAQGRRAAYVPLGDALPDPEMLQGLGCRDLVALDDLQCVLGSMRLERQLLGLHEALAAFGGKLVVTASQAAARCRFALRDTASRMRAAASFQIAELGDSEKAALLAERARRRGLQLSSEVLDYWLTRSQRVLGSLLADLDRLDQAAMAEQRRVTVPLVKKVLAL